MSKLTLTLLLANTSLAAVLTHGPMVGHTTHDSTRVWVRADQSAEVRVRATAPDGRSTLSDPVRLLAEDNFCGTAVVEGLAPKTAYTYRVLLDGAEIGPASPQRVTTFPRPGEPGVVTIGFGHSLWGAGAQTVWDAVAAKKPDLFLLMGDNIYSNSTVAAKQRGMYLEYRADPHFRPFGARVPIYAVWDDHDYGVNNSDRTQPGKERSLKTFNELWPNPPSVARAGDGIWSKFTVGQSEFYLMDVRYHRSPNDDPDGPAKTMLGGEQRQWLTRSLADSKAVFRFPVSGSSWNCGGVEAWNHRFVQEYDSILADVRADQVEGVILLGGDQHQCKIGVRPKESWDGYDLHEWMVGRLWAGDREGQSRAFGLITVDTSANPPTAKLEFFGHDGAPRTGTRVLYTTPGALRAMWDSPAGSMGEPPRSSDGELRPDTSGPVWDSMPLVEGETLSLEDLRFDQNPAAAQEPEPDPGDTIGLRFIDTGFENASPLNWDVDAEGNINVFLTYDHERSSPNRANGHWHFRVEARPGTTQTIILHNLWNIWNRKLGGIASLGRRHTSHISDDGKNWRAVPLEALPDHRLKLTVEVPTGSLYIARTEPYRVSDLDALLDSISGNPLVEITPIGRTAEGRQLEIVRVGRESAPNRLLLRARAHAFEAGGNWVVQGLIKTLLRGDADSRKYLDRYAVYILPMANKDGVARGRTRFNLRGMDLNRNWDTPADPMLAPENHALEQWLHRMSDAGRKPHLAIDFHNDSGGKVHLSRPDPPDPEYSALMGKYVALLREHSWFTEGATGENFHNPGTIGEGLLARYGINACVHELNVDWIRGLNDYPSGKHWELLGAQLCQVYYEYFDQ